MAEGKNDSIPGVLHVLMDVGSNPSEEEFHQWYNHEHGPAQMTT